MLTTRDCEEGRGYMGIPNIYVNVESFKNKIENTHHF
jgi:hypothetical protein